MDDSMKAVQMHYDENPADEWQRLENHPFEFLLSTWMMEKHIRPGQRVLDIGGGPGRYAIHFAQMGCDVTLADLSAGNVALAKEKAAEAGVQIHAIAANCLDLEALDLGQFDHVLLMGPLYHLLSKEDRVRAVRIALKHLKPGGVLCATFIMAFAGIIFDLKNGGFIVEDCANPLTGRLIDCIAEGSSYAGPAFTSACFMHQCEIEPFMAQFGLEKLHLFGQEGILAPNERDLLQRDQAEIDCWIALAKRFLERPELLSYSEHAMYIGRKPFAPNA